MKREVLKEVNNFIIFLFVFFYLGVLRVMENIIDFLRTKYFFYFVMALFLISNITYRKIVGKLKEELEYEINFKSKVYWSSRAGHFYLRIFILQWTHSIVGCMRPFKIVIMNELRDFLFNNVFIHGRSVT